MKGGRMKGGSTCLYVLNPSVSSVSSVSKLYGFLYRTLRVLCVLRVKALQPRRLPHRLEIRVAGALHQALDAAVKVLNAEIQELGNQRVRAAHPGDEARVADSLHAFLHDFLHLGVRLLSRKA